MDRCPNCGYCPHCGRANPPAVVPMVPAPMPVQPGPYVPWDQWPWWQQPQPYVTPWWGQVQITCAGAPDMGTVTGTELKPNWLEGATVNTFEFRGIQS